MSKKQKKIILTLNIILILIDQISKVYIISTNNMLGNFYWKNFFERENLMYILASIIVIIALIRYILKDNQFIKMSIRIVLSFAISGAIGNAIDRIWMAKIITLQVGEIQNFNLAYTYICMAWIGLAGILTLSSSKFLKDRKEKLKIIDQENKIKNEENSSGKRKSR